jgi:hypothetical protein
MEGGHAFCRGVERSRIRLPITDLRGEEGERFHPQKAAWDAAPLRPSANGAANGFGSPRLSASAAARSSSITAEVSQDDGEHLR